MHDGSHPDLVDAIVERLRAELPESGAEAIAPIARFSRLSAFLSKPVYAAIAPHGLGEAEYNVLAALRRSGAPYYLAPSEVSRLLLFTSGGLTPVLDRLESRGLVRREPDEADRRKLKVRLTPEGMALHERALASHVEVSKELTAVLSPEQLEQLNDLLRVMLLSFDEPRAE